LGPRPGAGGRRRAEDRIPEANDPSREARAVRNPPGNGGAAIAAAARGVGEERDRHGVGRDGDESLPRTTTAATPEPRPRHYVSHDSAPVGFAVVRPSWLAPLFLCVFAGLSAALIPTLPTLMESYAEAIARAARVPERDLLPDDASLSFRPFLALLIVLLSLFAAGSVAQRLKLLVFSLSLYSASVLVVDVVLATASAPWVPSPFSPVGGIAAGFTGLLAIITSVFTRYRLPEGVTVTKRVRTPRRVVLVLATSVAGGLALVTVFSYLRTRYFDELHVRLLGGLDSEIVIFLLTVSFLLFVAAIFDRTVRPSHGPPLSVAVLIPAFNEAHCIADTIRAVDTAAERYRASCRLYVVDNGSRDATREVAVATLARCRSLDGTVLDCPAPGKSRALNFGLLHIHEEIVVRIDADTVVAPSLLERIVPWYWDPSVGGVSGLPLPKPTTPGWLYPLRLMEIYYGIVFLRVAQSAADGAMVMPGAVASYRRQLLRELGGFAEGINGEDADITMRIGRLGYRIVTDPTAHAYSEVPENLAHLREQRQRWARGLFHMAGRNMSTIWMRQGARGLWILPWSIFNASRRAVTVPILVGAITVEIIEPAVLSLREISTIAGFIVGLQLIVIAALLLTHRRFAVIPFLPAYLVFRIFRAYVALEALLTLPLAPAARKSRLRVSQPTRTGRPPSPMRDARASSRIAEVTR
jgi:cellulose synthase/poly-beta-1,6-N-acetylglucosamine synthase-like glycosyltransferase